MHYRNKDMFFYKGLWYATCDVYTYGEYAYQAIGSGLTPALASQAMYKSIIDMELSA